MDLRFKCVVCRVPFENQMQQLRDIFPTGGNSGSDNGSDSGSGDSSGSDNGSGSDNPSWQHRL